MRAVIQRVTQANVVINDNIRSAIAKGLLVLVGIEDTDTTEDIIWLSSKIVNLRSFGDADGVMNESVKDQGGEILVVSQFTLHAATQKGNRPSFTRAARPEQAIPLYEHFIREQQSLSGKTIQTGRFGAGMQVSLVNDGPVTIYMDSKVKE